MQIMVTDYFAVWSSKTNSLFSIDKVPLLFSTANKALRFLAKLESAEWGVERIQIMMESYEEIMDPQNKVI